MDLPCSRPVLELLFTLESREHFVAGFLPDQVVDVVFFRETFDHVVLVLPDPLDQIGGNSDIERAVALAGEDVDAGTFHKVEG